MNCLNNFLNQKTLNLVDDSDFDKNFQIHRVESPLYKTTNNFKKVLFSFNRKNS